MRELFVNSEENGWNTDKEIWFLERLGLHKFHFGDWEDIANKPHMPYVRINMLINYFHTIKQRMVWPRMDPRLIAEFCVYEVERILETGEAYDVELNESDYYPH